MHPDGIYCWLAIRASLILHNQLRGYGMISLPDPQIECHKINSL